VTVIDPDTVAAISANICPNRYPKIKIETTIAGYTYNIYTEAGAFAVTMQGNGDSILIVIPEPISVSTNYFVETVNTKTCASTNKTRVRTEVVNYVSINPDEIPRYGREQQYSFQLETNAVSPYEFTTDDRLVSGFSLSEMGLISGIAARNGAIDPVPFIVKVMDINGCFASKEYVLESDIFVPQVFTPNGDGKNDIFMKGHHVRIFDRMGLKIYESLDGWNGMTQNNSPATGDTYFYTILDDKQEDLKKGAITLIKRE
jgi:gliding motility-associated-like protein